MRKYLPTLTLAGTLLLGSLSEAGSRPPKTAPTPSTLNTIERLCQTVGSAAYRHVESRNAGISYFTMLETYRQLMAVRPSTTHLEASIDASILDNLRFVYDTPSVTPAGNRQATERMCLQAIEQYVQDNPSVATTPRY
jgi:hypothetical protein